MLTGEEDMDLRGFAVAFYYLQKINSVLIRVSELTSVKG